jgi:hypothetical protein
MEATAKMTIELTEFRCPTCGHILGEEEYRHACNEENKRVQEICDEQMVIWKRVQEGRHSKEMQEREKRLRQEMQEREEKHKRDIDIRVKQEVQSQIDEIKLQNEQAKSEAVEQALKRSYEEWRQKEEQYQQRIERAQKCIWEQQIKLDSMSPELRGTSGEKILTEDLHKAFPRDDLEEKRVGVEMPDTIQTIMENGERIVTQILWDRKTGNITPLDIKKAKRYKEKYNTDYCILVSSKRIAAKYCKNGTEGLIGRSDDGTMLLHESIAVEMAEEIRNFIIKETRLVKNNNGRTSKQSRLYDYITSPERLRKIKRIRKNREDLEDLIRKQIEYNIENGRTRVN